jgi:uncharacterized membrane protein YphA (DoxX/SURF4 family)
MRHEETAPSAWRNTYYPGFLGALFLVLLRVAIGWHFHYEAWEKVESTRKGGKPFSAEGYLRNATGPLGPYFRGMVPDVNGLARLDPDRLKASWRADVTRIADHYGFNGEQRSKAQVELTDSDGFADVWFHDREMSEKRLQYLHDLAGVQKVERDPGAMSYERERAAAKRKDLDTQRKDLLKELDARGSALREAVAKLATPEQIAAAGPYTPPPSQLDRINLMTTYGLWAIGLCLMLGLLTRFAALAAAVFLAQIYLSMPPWPGLPPAPVAEGHYFIVSKNLIEMLACLALACLPTGQWLGLDALLFGWTRRDRRPPAAPAISPDAGYPGRFGPRGTSNA